MGQGSDDGADRDFGFGKDLGYMRTCVQCRSVAPQAGFAEWVRLGLWPGFGGRV
jgi:hypothetical protein